jgi:hypothetical protein
VIELARRRRRRLRRRVFICLLVFFHIFLKQLGLSLGSGALFTFCQLWSAVFLGVALFVEGSFDILKCVTLSLYTSHIVQLLSCKLCFACVHLALGA